MRLINDHLLNIARFNVNSKLELRPGVTLLVGDNGIGKSSLLHFFKQQQTTLFANKKLAFMDQLPLLPLSDLRCHDVYLIMSETYPHFSKETWQKLVIDFNFEMKLMQGIHSLSGGENQILKFLLMRSLNADFYFLDEPSQYLDQNNWQKLQNEIKKDLDKSWLIVEHRPENWLGFDFQKYIMQKTATEITITKEGQHA